MKKILLFILTLAFLLSAVGCDSKSKSINGTTTNQSDDIQEDNNDLTNGADGFDYEVSRMKRSDDNNESVVEYTCYFPNKWRLDRNLMEKYRNDLKSIDDYTVADSLVYTDKMHSFYITFTDKEIYNKGKNVVSVMREYEELDYEIESSTTNQGDLVYYLKQDKNWIGIIFKNGKRYELEYRGDSEKLKEFENLLKASINTFTIIGEQDFIEAKDYRYDSADLMDYEAENFRKLNDTFNGLAEDKEKVSIKELNELEEEIFGQTGEMSLDNSTLYGAARTLLYGLTYADYQIVDYLLLPHSQGQGVLSEYFKDFQANFEYLLDYEIRADSTNKHTNEYVVYFDLDVENADAQFYVTFNKINGKYYYERIK